MSRKTDLDTLNEFMNYPIESSSAIMERFASLPGAVVKGNEPARFVYVPGARKDKALLVAHADTIWYEGSLHNDIFTRPGIGADDRTGCAILWLLKDSGHSLLVLDGEEKDLDGARYLAEDSVCLEAINREHSFMVEFDHQGGSGLQFYNISTKIFRQYVPEMMPGYTDEKSCYATDIGVLCRDICGVNISAGYYKEHTPWERIEPDEWLNTLEHARKWLSEASIPRFELIKEPEDPVVIAERIRKNAEVEEIIASLNIN